MLPLTSPLFNLREAAKHMALLEDHLNNPLKRCQDCIQKHFLLIEGFLEEAVGLCDPSKVSRTTNLQDYCPILSEQILKIQNRWVDGENPCEIAQALRVIRKSDVFDFRKFGDPVLESQKTASNSRLASIRLATLSAFVLDSKWASYQGPHTVCKQAFHIPSPDVRSLNKLIATIDLLHRRTDYEWADEDRLEYATKLRQLPSTSILRQMTLSGKMPDLDDWSRWIKLVSRLHYLRFSNHPDAKRLSGGWKPQPYNFLTA